MRINLCTCTIKPIYFCTTHMYILDCILKICIGYYRENICTNISHEAIHQERWKKLSTTALKFKKYFLITFRIYEVIK